MPRTQSVKLPNGFGASECLLVFDGDVLLAVLACLSDDMFGTNSGKWHVEATFCSKMKVGEVFKDFNAVKARLSREA